MEKTARHDHIRSLIPAVFLCILGLFASAGNPTPAYAADFFADYDVDYAVSPSGSTIVTQKVNLTNNKTNLYPKQYAISLDSDTIKNVIAYDAKGMITPSISRKDGKTEINLTFNDKIVGSGKTMSFELRYEQADIVDKRGNIWEINIPGIENDPAIQSYTVRLRTPPNFGDSAYTKPQPMVARTWGKSQMIHGGISIAFGLKQEYTAELYYDLENAKPDPGLYEIALPPETSYQRVQIISIEPKPMKTVLDADGNWMATYSLSANEKVRVSAKLAITTYTSARPDFQKPSVDPAAYLTPKEFWTVDDPAIKKIAEEHNTPKAIFDFVVSALTYNFNRTDDPYKRYGASEALKNPKDALCSEFTDVFIAIARAAGIPAREAVGYAYTTNTSLRPIANYGDILHSWPEYYDRTQNLWIPVDPTWTNTTKGIDYFDSLDFNHIAFVIHGSSSDYPYPAGSFKQGSVPKRNVIVSFADKTPKPQQQGVATYFDVPKDVMLGSVLNGTVTVQNTSGSSMNDLTVTIRNEPFSFNFTKNEPYIPPYGTITIPIAIQTTGLYTKKKGALTVTVNGEETTHIYALLPRYTLIVPGVCVIAGGILLVWTILKKR